MFKLDFDIPESSIKINRKDQVYLIGSCFSDSIGDMLRENKFTTLSNPFGTIYNPHSIFKHLRGAIDASQTVESHGVFYHWDAHGRVSSLNQDEVARQISSLQQASTEFLANAKHLVITLGTAFVYELNDSKQVVANCHKVPATNFTKRLLSVEEITTAWQKTSESLLEVNPNLNITFTVSPVRHIRNGLAENNLSKSILIQSVHEITGDYSHVSYFPSYEIAIDELRDYRFFASDMVHPSNEAVSYIWKRFQQCYFDLETQDFINEWSKIQSALAHKPFQKYSDEHQKFIKNIIVKLTHLKDQIDVTKELEVLQNQLV